ncbi:multinuclear nonheme iron-dependent oxidase [Hymenobacter actinosclerus]|uniref:Uncharacterized conserved protein, UPF0276 family n=1 Tax=Hymenobacter actinosclerus TaxID=82805 RepID=A0A1I0BHH4_9BACT|nr:DUF692 family multinuclear iron-containing protein [Hymenobacter actinosclerus]SET05662.1 Uncharacterized conserved protein, UPF0276 family [Hymenobacter actinosclerus]
MASTPSSATTPASPVLAALACNLDADLLTAAFPLLEQGRVAALEWSFDALFAVEQVPEWFQELLRAYSAQGRLLGHGVYCSLLSGRWTHAQQQWLTQLRTLARQLPFDHVTEHFGFFTGANFHAGAPLPIPYTSATLRLGQDRLQRVQAACECPVGLENLAFAYSLDEVRRHGEFLEKLVEPVNGFLILDLHNVYCQLHNFRLPADELLALYPLHRVREIHLSGGSWAESGQEPGRQIRRDTHDDAVPAEVFQLLKWALPRCPNLKYVVLEQVGGALRTARSQAQFRVDFGRMEALVQEYQKGSARQPGNAFRPRLPLAPPGPVIEDELLHTQQRQLGHILETAASFEQARQRLQASSLAHTAWQIEHWEPAMLETAISIAQKWQ